MGRPAQKGHVQLGHHARLGQVFLVDRNIARKEAMFAKGKRVIEFGTGTGILTEELSKEASFVLSVEIDKKLFERASHVLNYSNLKIINADFFDANIPAKDFDIFISNPPYYLSKKVISWLSKNRMPALICIQKEFAEKLGAKPGGTKYTAISVISALSFSMQKIASVKRHMFRPVPKVDSVLLSLEPMECVPAQEILSVIALLMEHSKNTIRKAVYYVAKQYTGTAREAKEIQSEINAPEARVSSIPPEQLAEIASELCKLCSIHLHKE